MGFLIPAAAPRRGGGGGGVVVDGGGTYVPESLDGVGGAAASFGPARRGCFAAKKILLWVREVRESTRRRMGRV